TLHRFLLNAPRGVLVDHRNGNGLDCRRFNLRAATPAQNNANRRTRSSGWRGVRKVRGQWWAVIKEGEQQLKLGPFNSALAAAWAYNREATRIHGEFALLNKLNAWT
ncbi:MAG: HNH endonuclease, partial [Burkholderiaceae bacterium]